MQITEIKLNDIIDPLFQPRDKLEIEGLEALATSIREIGLINPIIVKPHADQYRLIAGTRRFHAFKMLGKDSIPAKVVEEGDRESLLIQFSENFHRQDLNPLQLARTLEFLLTEMKLSTSEVALLCNKSREWVSKTLSLLEMPDYLQEAVQTNLLSSSVAQELDRIPNQSLKEQYTSHAVAGGCTEKVARQWAQQAKMTLAAQADRVAQREAGADALPPPPPPPLQRQTCYICGAPEDRVVLEPVLLCWHCKQNLAQHS